MYVDFCAKKISQSLSINHVVVEFKVFINTLDVNLCNLRQDLHHELLPVNLDSAEIMVRIMWTKYNLNSTRFGYCVPLVDRWTCRVQCI